ncbi:MAG: major capsid protein [Methylococcaceae bacterium]
MDIYSTHYLSGVVNSLITPSLFLLNRFFPNQVQAEAETIHFDVIDKTRRLAPFVSPMVAGKIMEEKGYTTLSFKPAYIKIKTPLEPSTMLKRIPGEPIGPGTPTDPAKPAWNASFNKLSPLQKQQYRLNAILLDQFDTINRRLEWMAAQALLTGSVTVSGEQYQTSHLNFGRHPDHTITLPDYRQWGEPDANGRMIPNPGANPLRDLDEWRVMALQRTGATLIDVVMTPDVFHVFKENPVIESRLLRVQGSDPTTLQTGTQTGEGGTFLGEIDGYRIWVYASWFIDENGVEKPLLPPGTVILTSSELAGTRAFGAILDMEAQTIGYALGTPIPVPVFAKSWTDDDPSLRWIMSQCAPLVVPTRVNASVSAQVIPE